MGASKSPTPKRRERSLKFDGTIVSKGGLKSDCTFFLTVPLPLGPKDRCSCESEHENSITKAIVSGQRTKKRHPRKRNYQGDLERRTWEYDCITLLRNTWTHAYLKFSKSHFEN